MVGKHEQSRVVVDLRHHFAEHLIDLLVKLLQCRPVLSGKRGVVRRMLRIGETPHHVRVQIEAGKIEEEQAIVKFRELDIERAPVFGKHGVGLLQIFFVVEHAVGERLGVFGDALRVKFADLFRQITASNSMVVEIGRAGFAGSMLIGDT